MKTESFESFYRVNLTLFKITGLIPFETVPKFVNLFFIFLSVFSPVFCIGPSIYGVICHWNDIDANEKTHIIVLEEIIFFGLFKAIILIVKRIRVSELIDHCKNLWYSVENDEEYRSMKPFITQGKYICNVSIGLCIGVMFVIAIGPIFAEVVYDGNGTVIQSKQLPFPTGMLHQNQLIFNVWWAFQVPLIPLSCLNTLAIDHGISALTFCAAAQMKIVGMRLEDITELHKNERRDDSRDVDAGRDVEIQKKFYKCISRHQNVLKYCKDMEDIFNPIFLLATILGMTTIAVDGLALISETGRILEFAPHLIGVLIELLAYCWAPQRLLNECVYVSRAIYSLPWTSWSARDQKSVRIMLTRSQKPAILTAGKFAIMCLPLFSELISRAVSFFTMMNSTM